MTCTVRGNGRFCNNLIRNIAVSLIAEKHDLMVEYSYRENMTALGLRLFSGTRSHPYTVQLTEDNYFQLLEGETLQCNLDPNWNYFQKADTIRLIRSFLHDSKESIMGNNSFAARYATNNDAFVHVRLTDTKNSNPGLVYYLKALSASTFDTLYIATDDFDDDVIKGLVDAYPSAELLRKSEVETIQFGSTCKHVILSHGTFSAVIGYLSYCSNVFYPQHCDTRIWYERTMFDMPDWRVVKDIL